MANAYAMLRDHARERKIPFQLEFAEFVSFALKTNYIALKGNDAECLTVDRIRNTEGYVSGNIQPLSRAKNAEKRMKYDEIRQAKAIANERLRTMRKAAKPGS